jgi:hypothetical protein
MQKFDLLGFPGRKEVWLSRKQKGPCIPTGLEYLITLKMQRSARDLAITPYFTNTAQRILPLSSLFGLFSLALQRSNEQTALGLCHGIEQSCGFQHLRDHTVVESSDAPCF